jgi:hypothetical protein
MTADSNETMETLCDEYNAWLTAQGLPEMSADELLHEDITKEQRRYVSAFYDRWEAMLKRTEG